MHMATQRPSQLNTATSQDGIKSSTFVRQGFFWFRFFVAMLGLLLIVGSNLLTPPRTGQLTAMLLLAGFAALLWNFPFELLGEKATLVAAITVAMGLIFGPAQVSIAATGGILIGLTIRRACSGEQAKPGIVQDVLAALFQIGVIISALALTWLVYAWLLTAGQGIGLASSAALLIYALIHGVLLLFDGLLRRPGSDERTALRLRGLVGFELLPLPFIYGAITLYEPAGPGILVMLAGIAVVCAVLLNRLDNAHNKMETTAQELALKQETNRILEAVITSEKRHEEARDMLTTTLVHDLRSPTSAIVGALDVLAEFQQREHPEEDEIVTQAMVVARHSAQRLLILIDSLMDIARAQAGRLDLSLGEVNLHKLANAVLKEFTPQAREYGILLQNEITEAIPTVRADQNKIMRVLSNLVDNAIKFTPAGGQVVLSAELAKGDMLAVQVRDTGPGVPAEYRETIFERFSQVPGSAGKQRGSGLGLTFCRLVVEANGGKIWVETNPGGGSCFTFTLPLMTQPA
jgi:signal transduction histidine kinase